MNGADVPRAANGTPLPQRDPRNSCDGLKLELGDESDKAACAPISCGCLAQDLTSAVEATRCITSIDCDAYCALGDWGYLRLFFCSYLPSCTQNSDCMAPQTCIHALGERLGNCSPRLTGNECFQNGDCDSNACVVDSDIGRASCGGVNTGAACNRNEHCSSGQCLLAANRYLGACAGPNVNAPCLSASDCSPGMSCVPGLFPTPPTVSAPTQLGACTNGFPGAPCNTGTDCLEGYVCLPSHTCSPGRLGDACETNADCPGNLCSHASGAPICSDGAAGTPCSDVSECRTPICTAWGCSSGAPGSKCNYDAECIGSSCITTPNLCSDGALGRACDNLHPCQPGLVCNGLECQAG
jgi:hypothetical protein